MKKIILIGGSGYIGCVVARKLTDNGHEVTSFDNLIYSQENSDKHIKNKDLYKFIHGDIRDYKKINSIIKNFDIVIILSGLVGDPITKKYKEEAFEINNRSIKNIINSCVDSNVSRLLFISTCSNYGLIGNEEFATEDTILNPLSDYAKEKINIEKFILSLKNKVKFYPTILRFATAFGLSPRMRFDLTVNQFTREIFFNKKILIYDPETWRPYCHVKDFANLIQLVIKSEKDKVDFEIFNAGDQKNNFNKIGIVNMIKKYLPNFELEFKENGGDARNYKVDFTKVKNILGFEAEYSVEKGIKEIMETLDQGKFKSTKDYQDNLGNYIIK